MKVKESLRGVSGGRCGDMGFSFTSSPKGSMIYGLSSLQERMP